MKERRISGYGAEGPRGFTDVTDDRVLAVVICVRWMQRESALRTDTGTSKVAFA